MTVWPMSFWPMSFWPLSFWGPLFSFDIPAPKLCRSRWALVGRHNLEMAKRGNIDPQDLLFAMPTPTTGRFRREPVAAATFTEINS